MEHIGLKKVKPRKSKSKKEEKKPQAREESADEGKRKQKDDETNVKNLQKPMQEMHITDKPPLKENSGADLAKKTAESALKEVNVRDYDQVNTRELNEYLGELENVKGSTYIGKQKKKEMEIGHEPRGIESFIELYVLKNGDGVKKKQATGRAEWPCKEKSGQEMGKSEKHESLKSLAKTQEDDSLRESRGQYKKPSEFPQLPLGKEEIEIKREAKGGSSKKADTKGIKMLDESHRKHKIQKKLKDKESKDDQKDKLYKEVKLRAKEVDVAESLKIHCDKTCKAKKEEDLETAKKEESFKSSSKKTGKHGKPSVEDAEMEATRKGVKSDKERSLKVVKRSGKSEKPIELIKKTCSKENLKNDVLVGNEKEKLQKDEKLQDLKLQKMRKVSFTGKLGKKPIR